MTEQTIATATATPKTTVKSTPKKRTVKPKATIKTPPKAPKVAKVAKPGIKVVTPKVTKIVKPKVAKLNKDQTNQIEGLRLKLKLAETEIRGLNKELILRSERYNDLKTTIASKKWYQFIAK